jgi:hypothetical protein
VNYVIVYAPLVSGTSCSFAYAVATVNCINPPTVHVDRFIVYRMCYQMGETA